MAIDRTTLLRGPGMVTYDSAVLHSEGDIEVTLQNEYFDVETSAFGVIDRRKKSTMVEVTFTPKEWDDLTKIFPYATTQIGASIYGATDKSLTITPRDGASSGLVIANAAITSLPSITLSAERAILGSMTFTGLLANSSDPGLQASYVNTSAVGALTGFELGKIPNSIYTAAWSTLTGIATEEGFEISFDLGTEDVVADGHGVIDKRLTSLEATCTFTPLTTTIAQTLATAIGALKVGAPPTKSDLVITGTGTGAPVVTLKNCFARQAQPRYGAQVNRQGQIEFSTVRTQTSGVLDALWTFGTVA